MVDFQIDWETILRNDNVPLLFLTPFLDEAGWLFQAGGALWPGRVRSGQLSAYGQRLTDLGYMYRRRALAWAAGGLYAENHGHSTNTVLGMSTTQCKFWPPDDLCEQPSLVPPLLMTAQYFATACFRELAPRYNEREGAHKLEDELELLSEAPCFGRDVEVDAPALILTQNRAILRCCADLASQAASLRYRWWAGQRDESGREHDIAYQTWNTQAEAYNARSFEAFQTYVVLLGQSPEFALFDTGSTDYGHRFDYHLSVQELEIAERILSDMIQLMLGGLREPGDPAGLPQLEDAARRFIPTSS